MSRSPESIEKKRKEVFLCGILRLLLLWEFISLHIFINNYRYKNTMGIKGLSKLLAEHAPGCSMERKFQSYLDRKIAIDASMHIYQYLVRFYITFEISKILSLISSCSRSSYSKTFHLDLAHTSDDAVFLFLFSFVFRWLSVALARVS